MDEPKRPSYEELIEGLLSMVLQHATNFSDEVEEPDGWRTPIDTGALSANAEAVDLLERLGLAEVDEENSFGRVLNGTIFSPKDLEAYIRVDNKAPR